MTPMSLDGLDIAVRVLKDVWVLSGLFGTVILTFTLLGLVRLYRRRERGALEDQLDQILEDSAGVEEGGGYREPEGDEPETDEETPPAEPAKSLSPAAVYLKSVEERLKAMEECLTVIEGKLDEIRAAQDFSAHVSGAKPPAGSDSQSVS